MSDIKKQVRMTRKHSFNIQRARSKIPRILHARIQRGAGGPGPPENHKNIGFLSNTDPDPLKITKLPSQRSVLGHRRHDDGPLKVVLGSPFPSFIN